REVAEQPDKLRDELDRLRREKIETLKKRLAVRVLEIDGRTGKLYYHDPERVEVAGKADALALIERARNQTGPLRHELYYLILLPRERSPLPSDPQLRAYQEWFKGVAMGFDDPQAKKKGGR